MIYLLTYKIWTYKACKQEDKGHITLRRHPDISHTKIISNEDVMGNTHPVIHKEKRKKKPEKGTSKRKGDKIKRSVDNGDEKTREK